MKERIKMTPLERAKQFAPFAALRGHGEELEKAARSPVVPPSLSEDGERVLNARLKQKRPGDRVRVLLFDGRELRRVEGRFSLLDRGAKTIRIEGETFPLSQLVFINE